MIKIWLIDDKAYLEPPKTHHLFEVVEVAVLQVQLKDNEQLVVTNDSIIKTKGTCCQTTIEEIT